MQSGSLSADHAKGGACHFRRCMAMAGQAVRAVYCRKKAQESQNGVAAAKVAWTFKSAVSRVSQPAADATAARPADWEVGDTAGLSRRAGCATRRRRTAAENPRENE